MVFLNFVFLMFLGMRYIRHRISVTRSKNHLHCSDEPQLLVESLRLGNYHTWATPRKSLSQRSNLRWNRNVYIHHCRVNSGKREVCRYQDGWDMLVWHGQTIQHVGMFPSTYGYAQQIDCNGHQKITIWEGAESCLLPGDRDALWFHKEIGLVEMALVRCHC